MKDQPSVPVVGFWATLFFFGFIWLRSGIEKIQSHVFPQTLGKTLFFFANGIPTSAQPTGNPYPWFKSFLLTTIAPQSQIIGTFVQWGELFSGLALVVLVITLYVLPQHTRFIYYILLLPLIVTFSMNVMYLLASGWTSPSAETVNLVMLWIEGVSAATLLYHCWRVRNLSQHT